MSNPFSHTANVKILLTTFIYVFEKRVKLVLQPHGIYSNSRTVYGKTVNQVLSNLSLFIFLKGRENHHIISIRVERKGVSNFY